MDAQTGCSLSRIVVTNHTNGEGKKLKAESWNAEMLKFKRGAGSMALAPTVIER
jgi:hypothetical protein